MRHSSRIPQTTEGNEGNKGTADQWKSVTTRPGKFSFTGQVKTGPQAHTIQLVHTSLPFVGSNRVFQVPVNGQLWRAVVGYW